MSDSIEGQVYTRAEIQALLNQHDEFMAAVDVFKLQKAEAIKALIPAAIQAKIDVIEEETKGKIEAAEINAATRKNIIKASLLALPDDERGTVQGQYSMAVFVKGRKSVDQKALLRALDNLQKKYPVIAGEIADLIATCMVEGEPSITIRKA